MQPLPILYHKGKSGALYSWRIWTDGDTIHTEYGQLDGLKSLAAKRAKAQNVGRANATMPEQQAELEARSMWQNQRDRKYSETLDGVRDTPPLPMLASSKKWEQAKKKAAYPAWVQPKLDGARTTARWEDGRVVLRSRTGKEWAALPHINRELEVILPKDYVLDGEIYLHGVTFQEVMRLIKSNKPESMEISFNVYDVVEVGDGIDHAWDVRKQHLDHFFATRAPGSLLHVMKVEGAEVYSDDDVISVHDVYAGQGYEGAIVRNMQGFYLPGFRSDDLMKVKLFEDAEFEVVDFTHGGGKYETCVKWICVTPEGKQFAINPKGTLREKKWYLEHGNDFVGKKLTVRFFGKTEDGIPRIAVGHGFRHEEDLPANQS